MKAGSLEPEKMKKHSSSVTQRWLTALVAMPVVLLFAWFGGWATLVGLSLVVFLSLQELQVMFRHAGYQPLSWLSYGLTLLFLVAAMFPNVQLLLLLAGLAVTLFLSFFALFGRKKIEGSLIDWAITLAIPFYLGFPMSFFVMLRGYVPALITLSPHLSVAIPRGLWWSFVTLLGVWGFDGAAFFSGRYLGRHKLAPMISPAKTWEGVIGGMPVPIIAALLFTVYPLGVPWWLAIVLGILIGTAATMGDLAESLLKRQVGVKDSGQIMPGHGGMLDRIDSLMFGVVVVYFFSLFFTR